MDNTEMESRRTLGTGAALLRTLAAMALCAGLEGCVVVGGSSRGGFFLWPGGLGLLVIVVLFVLLTRRR